MYAGTEGPARGSVRSMTGFGRGRHAEGEVEVVAEVRAVNHRFLDISLRVPKTYSCFEPDIRKIVSAVIHRGKVDVTVSRIGGKSGFMEVMLDEHLAAGYHRCLKELQGKLRLGGDISLSDMLTLKEIIVPIEREEGIEQERTLVEESLRRALRALNEMKEAEGAALWRDIEERLITIRDTARLIEPLANQVTIAAKERLERRIAELTGGLELDKERLLQEVALLADRSDVTEELTRLSSHVVQFLAFGKEGSPLGRKLDFLLQELHREVNTVGSKAASTEISSHVVSMKAEVEKIREQTQNIE